MSSLIVFFTGIIHMSPLALVIVMLIYVNFSDCVVIYHPNIVAI